MSAPARRVVIEEVRLPHWPPGRVAYRCPECGCLRPSVDGAIDCCADVEAYEEAMRQACWPVSSDPTVRRRATARAARDYPRRGRAVAP